MIRQIKMPGVVLNFRDEGQGEPVVFIHGFPLDHTMWNAQVDHFAATHRCLAVDMRGFGSSSIRPGTTSMGNMADDIAHLLDALSINQPITLIALSMGGYVAWQFWQRHSQKLARLVLCDTRAIADTPEGARTRLETADKVEKEGPAFLADSMLPKLYASTTQSERPAMVAASRHVILNNSPSGIAAAARGMAARPDVTDWLPQITVPTLLLTGEADEISTVKEMAGIAEKMPLATHVVIRGAGHMSPQEDPDAANQAISRFLGATATAQ